MAQNWDFADMAARKDERGYAFVSLGEDDTVPLPGTTKRHLRGPGWVVMQFDGGSAYLIERGANTEVVHAPQPL